MKTQFNTQKSSVIYLSLLFLLSVGSLTRTYAQAKYVISGKIKNIPASQWIYISQDFSSRNEGDSVRVSDDGFHFSGIVQTDQPKRYYLTVGHLNEKDSKLMKRSLLGSFYIEPGNINIEISGKEYGESMVVTGTRSNVEMAAFSKLKNHINDEFYNSDQKNDTANISRSREDHQNDLRELCYKFIASHPGSYVSLELLSSDLWKLDPREKITTIFQTLDPVIRESEAGKTFTAILENMNRVTEGQLAPDFTEKDTNGTAVSLRSFRGKYVLLDFWASWCRPCRAENPFLIAAYAKFKDKNFEIVSVSLDRSRTSWLKAVKEDDLPWLQLSNLDPDRSESVIKYGVKGIPANFLIDPTGKIIATNLRGKALDDQLSGMLLDK